jgi:hypothetical protein
MICEIQMTTLLNKCPVWNTQNGYVIQQVASLK